MSSGKKRNVESSDSDESDDDFGPKPVEETMEHLSKPVMKPKTKRKRLQNESVSVRLYRFSVVILFQQIGLS